MDWTPGITFGDTCTAAGLHQLVDSATASNAAIPDFMATQLPVYIGSPSSLSSPNTGQVVYDNTINGSTNPCGVLLYYDGAVFRPFSGYYVKNAVGGDITTGDVVATSGLPAVAGTTVVEASTGALLVGRNSTANNALVVGVAAGNIADGAYGYVVNRGVIVVHLNAGAINSGVLKGSATAGYADAASASVTTGGFGRVLDVTNGICLLTGLLKGT